jgi:hypothetical protein
MTPDLDHIRKFMNYAKLLHVSFAECAYIHDVVNALLNGDLNLNSIPLRNWDVYHMLYVYPANRLKLESGGWSLANTVCTAKMAATISALVILGYPVDSPESVFESLNSLAMQHENKIKRA